MYLSETDKQEIIEICKRNDVSYCAVFGSFARGDATSESDVDLLVRFSKPVGLAFFALADEFETALVKKVDLATDKMIGTYIRESVMRDLKTIYEETEQSVTSPAYS
jgi:predicted nucleotidyltransferase